MHFEYMQHIKQIYYEECPASDCNVSRDIACFTRLFCLLPAVLLGLNAQVSGAP